MPSVLGKHQEDSDPQHFDLEDVDPEVWFGTNDPIPPEFPEGSEEDEGDDGVVELMQQGVACINQMKATRPEILRGVRVWKLLHFLPPTWLRGYLTDLYGLSQQTTHLDQFWSHSWQGSRWTKYVTMLYLHNCMPASIAGTLSTGVACGLVSAGFLGARQGGCVLFWFVAFCVALLLWRPRKLVFFDIACIHQTDGRAQKGGGHHKYGCIFESVDFHADSVGSYMGHKTAVVGEQLALLCGPLSLREFKVEHARSACRDRNEDRPLPDAAWYNSLGSFEAQVQTEVRMAVIDQLAYKVFSYQRALLVLTPHAWLRLEYATSHAGDPIRQIVDLAQMFTYVLAIFPVVDNCATACEDD
ncbi:unnamed protein product, partial [Symbiodinium sp. CCMP2456]